MQPLKTLLVALLLGGSAAVLAADQVLPAGDHAGLAAASNNAHSWPTVREIGHAWPEWMSNLQGSVLVLHDSDSGYSRAGLCAQPRCAEVPAQVIPAATSPSAVQHPHDSAQVRRANLPGRAERQAQMPQRFTF